MIKIFRNKFTGKIPPSTQSSGKATDPSLAGEIRATCVGTLSAIKDGGQLETWQDLDFRRGGCQHGGDLSRQTVFSGSWDSDFSVVICRTGNDANGEFDS
jgi:hypothetical protein